ncbi:beta-ketoacyl-[acyl-carrier-protein] synthase family protein (plasmid) [Skermanella mucosa]|uniref:beta-ketoacyl synthase N-terminal-like domain-containing protein n=1 Tax=Skermanella mucosa TaxID=1789672 RepID=UPI00192B504B|nr:beta-ketoacyl synthase N-terminal-like domain-containing protein [Skermanella mucosa]UEM24784.1 beta-ketoacyl-[acyl-carrier-protein] synthase family protein [Skermanella mucosa]
MTCQPVVTGAGLVTCLGRDQDAVWSRLMAGESGVAPIEAFDTAQCLNGSGGEIKDGLPSDGGARMAALLEGALRAALADADLAIGDLAGRRAALVVGSSFGNIFQTENGPVELDHYIRPLLGGLGLDLPVISVSSACSSGSDAIATGADLIDFAGFDVVLCGGVDVLDIYKMVGHSALGTLSPPRCTPFSADGDGTALGEGAALLVLEAPADAARRGARVRSVLTGRASTTDTNTLTSPDLTGAGAMRAIDNALAQDGGTAADIAYVNAHGSGTPVNDAMEAQVYAGMFGKHRPAISSTKAAFGHTLGATGAIEAGIAILALERGEAPPTSGLAAVHEDWRRAAVVLPGDRAPLPPGRAALSVTYGFGGANVALLFRRPEASPS